MTAIARTDPRVVRLVRAFRRRRHLLTFVSTATALGMTICNASEKRKHK